MKSSVFCLLFIITSQCASAQAYTTNTVQNNDSLMVKTIPVSFRPMPALYTAKAENNNPFNNNSTHITTPYRFSATPYKEPSSFLMITGSLLLGYVAEKTKRPYYFAPATPNEIK